MREAVNQEAGQAADEGAVDADVLQVAAEAEFQFVGDFFAVPAFDLFGDEGGGTAFVAAQQFAGKQGEEAVGEALGHAGRGGCRRGA